MVIAGLFGEILQQYLERSGRHVRQLSDETERLFGAAQRVPHNTINRWVRGQVNKPRNWRDILKLAAALQLTATEASSLLEAAGHSPLRQLQQQHSGPAEQPLWEKWPLPQQQTPPFQPPKKAATFVGRQALLRAIVSRLRGEPQGRLCCLQGMGGVGKTTLAIELAYRLRPHFPDGVLWVDAARVDPMSVLQSFAQAFGHDVGHYHDVSSRSIKVRELLAYKRLLFIFDDVVADQDIRPLLPPTGQSGVLLTTRNQALAVADEGHRFDIEPFSASQEESLTLFTAVLGTAVVRPQRSTFSQIAALAGHLPLALDIAANRLKHEPDWSPASLLAQLQETADSLTLFARGDRAVPAVFGLSYDKLCPTDQTLFRTLAVFSGGDMDVTAVHTICQLPAATASESLQRLQTLSLVQPGRAGHRYRLHPLLRQFGQTLLTPSETVTATRRMVTYYSQLVQDKADDFATLDGEMGHIRAAFDAAYHDGLSTLLIKGVLALYPYFQARGLLEMARRYLEKGEAAARAASDAAQLSQLLHNLGYVALKQGQPEEAASRYEEALLLSQQAQNRSLESDLLLKLGSLTYRQGDFDAARSYYQRALAQTSAEGEPYRFAALHLNLGLVAYVLGDLATAVSYYEVAMPIARELGNGRLLVTLLQSYGNLMDEQGNYAQAKESYEEGLRIARSAHNPELESRLYGSLGLVACSMGNYAAATAYFRKGLALAKGSGLQIQVCRQMANLGKAFSKRRQFEDANLHYGEAMKLAKQLNFPEDTAVILNQWGESYLDQKRYDEAETAYGDGLQAARLINHRREIAYSLFGLARIAAKRSDIAQARTLGQESHALLAEVGHSKAEEVQWWLAELPGEVC
ncbi:MAG: tetratricopeptide repeat protein [Chloroflexota bacterium]